MISKLFSAFVMLGSEWVMWLLLATSIVSVAIILERLKAIRKQERLGSSLWNQTIEPMMASKGPSEDIRAKASEMSKYYPCVESGLMDLVTSQDASRSKEDIGMIVQGYLGKKKIELEKNLTFLGTVGANAPFIGLFGTVLGIIKAFSDLAAGTDGDSQGMAHISSGISEALVATAIGLLVAIPAVVAFNYFQRKIKTIMSRSESLSNYLIGNLK